MACAVPPSWIRGALSRGPGAILSGIGLELSTSPFLPHRSNPVMRSPPGTAAGCQAARYWRACGCLQIQSPALDQEPTRVPTRRLPEFDSPADLPRKLVEE